MHRRTATKVRNGRVQRKNRWTRPSNTIGEKGVVIERARPGRGYVHAVTQDELYSFLQSLADWPRLAFGLDRIILDCGWCGAYGYYREGTIGLRAFDEGLTVTYAVEEQWRDRKFFEMVADDVKYLRESSDGADTLTHVVFHLTRPMARAFMLVHVLSHELGHHVDRMSHQLRDCPHGERFAFRFEWQHAPEYWRTYLRVFGDPRRER